MARTLKFGTDGNWATKKGSTLAYNDQNDRFKPLPFTTTRASGATRVNKEGLIEVVSNDVPRIDYTDSADGALLLEPQITNLITYSEDFSNAAWTKSNSSITSNSVISPDGTLNADELKVTSSGGNIYDNVGGSGDGVFSVFAKYKDVQYIRLRSTGSYAFFDIKNGVLGGTINTIDSKIEKYPNGWYKCSVIGNNTNSLAQFFVSSDGVNVGLGNVYLWGAQFEANSYPTSYIPTNGSAVTRVADTASGAGNSQVFNDSQGVLFANIAALSDDGTNRNITINDNTSDNVVLLKFDNSSNAIEYRVLSSGTLSVAKTATVSDTTLFNKVSVKYKQNDFALWINGFKMGTDTVGSAPIGLIKLDLSNYDEANKLYGKTKEIGYYDEILTDLELETLTSYRSLNELVTELNLNEL
jgi:hypothetical protein